MDALDIQSFTYEQRHGLLSELTAVLANCGGWILERKTLSADHTEIRVEIQLRAALDLYAAIIETGLELTRAGHDALTELCTRRKHMSLTTELGQIVVLRIEINFLDNVTLHSLLSSGSSAA